MVLGGMRDSSAVTTFPRSGTGTAKQLWLVFSGRVTCYSNGLCSRDKVRKVSQGVFCKVAVASELKWPGTC